MSGPERLKPLISVAEAGALLAVSPTTAYAWARRGELPGLVKMNRRYYVRRHAIEAFIRGGDIPEAAMRASTPLRGMEGLS